MPAGETSPTTADADVVRRFYDAVGQGDLATASACLTDDVAWYFPGRSELAGVHRGWPAIAAVLSRLRELSEGTLLVELLDVTIGDQFVVAVQRATAHRADSQLGEWCRTGLGRRESWRSPGVCL
jgi:ketosteroid isomerase-like protein